MSILRWELLAAAAALPLLGWVALLRARAGEALLRSLSEPRAGSLRRGGALVSLSALVLAGIALLGPSVASRTVEREERDLSLVVVVDVSRSMGGEVGRSRLDAGRSAAVGILGGLPGARVGLVVFGTSGHTLLPPTRDGVLVRGFLNALEPGLLSRRGSTAAGLREGLMAAASTEDPGGPGPDRILLVTDGEWWGDDPLPAELSVPVDVLWTDEPRELPMVSGQSTATDSGTTELARRSGGRHARLSDIGEVAALEETLRAASREVRRPTPEEIPTDAAPPLALLAGMGLAVAAALRRSR